MPFEIVRNNLVRMRVDAIVNTANPRPAVGSGTDAAVHIAAGPMLLEARKQIGPIARGEAAITPGFDLNAKYVIHTVGPIWQDGTAGEEEVLARCYRSSLELAAKAGCTSVAFPLISAGNYGFPGSRALEIAANEIRRFLDSHEMDVYLTVFDRDSVQISEQLSFSVASYIDEHYVEEVLKQEYLPSSPRSERRILSSPFRRRKAEILREEEEKCCAPMPCEAPMFAPMPAESLDELIRKLDAGFSATLLKLIDETGKKDSVIYKKANVDRRLFSKIRSDPDYRPSKTTALAFAVALELNLEQAKDLIGRAGYALSRSSIGDVIVEYFIVSRRYDIDEINAVLFRYDQSLLGNH